MAAPEHTPSPREQPSSGVPLVAVLLSMILIGVFASQFLVSGVSLQQMFGGGGLDPRLKKAIGTPAPPLQFVTLDGQSHDLAEFKGRRVVLNFWATWCPPCREELPSFQQFHREHSGKDLVVIGLSDESLDELRPVVASTGLEYTIGQFHQMNGVFAAIEGLPTTFLIAADGTIAAVHVGGLTHAELMAFALPARR